MSKIEVIMRYNAIIKRLQKAPATLIEITADLAQLAELHDFRLSVSKRTFQRDVEDILSLFQISIEYDFSKKKYFILGNDDEYLSSRILEAFDTLNALNSSLGYSDYLDLEKNNAQGYNNFHGVLHAIKNRQQLAISYQSYWDEQPSSRIIAPYLLKEFKNRWYLIANDLAKNELRTYGLDRIEEITFSKKKFTYPTSFKPTVHFKDSFGIIRSDDDKPVQQVVLSFDAHQGKYIKSLPLHHSQKIVKDDEDALVIKLQIYVTFDFIMQLLSYGESVEVLEPPFLREAVKERLMAAVSLYK